MSQTRTLDKPFRLPATAGLALALATLYLLTFPANHTEAEDAYAYAWAVEHAPFDSLNAAHHILFVPLMNALFTAARSLGCRCEALQFLALVSTAAALLAILLMHTLLLRDTPTAPTQADNKSTGRIDPELSLFASLALAGSYGFWRYAVEAEIPVLAIATALACFTIADSPNRSRHWLAGTLAGIATLIHVLNAIPTLACVTLLHALQKRPAAAVRHIAAAVTTIALGYALLGALANNRPINNPLPHESTRPAAAAAHPLATAPTPHTGRALQQLPTRLFAGAVGLGSALASGLPLLTLAPLATQIEKRFPDRLLVEELFLAQQIPRTLQILGLISSLLALGAGIALLARLCAPIAPPHQSAPRSRLKLPMLAWLATHTAIILAIEPANPELWVMALPPLWFLIATRLRNAPHSQSASRTLAVACASLFTHNLLGGIAPLLDPASDHDIVKTRLALAIATPADTLITGGGTGIARLLQYRHKGPVIDLLSAAQSFTARNQPALALADLLSTQSHGRIYLLPDTLTPPTALLNRFPAATTLARNAMDSLRPHMTETAHDGSGVLYELTHDNKKELSPP